MTQNSTESLPTEITQPFPSLTPKELSPIVLQRRLGQDDGLDLLRSLQSRSNVPVIIAGEAGENETDRVTALDLGADDYVIRPLAVRELLAHVQAVLRRRSGNRVATRPDPDRCHARFGTWTLDLHARRLADLDGQPEKITNGGYNLLVAFLGSPRRPLTRECLLQAIRVHEDIFDRAIDVQILRLRRKLEIVECRPPLIEMHRGVGYMLRKPVRMRSSRNRHAATNQALLHSTRPSSCRSTASGKFCSK